MTFKLQTLSLIMSMMVLVDSAVNVFVFVCTLQRNYLLRTQKIVTYRRSWGFDSTKYLQDFHATDYLYR